MKYRIIFLTVILFLVACTSDLTAGPTQTPVPPVQATATEIPFPTKINTPTPSATLTPTSSSSPFALLVFPKYKIFAELDYGRKILTAQQEVMIPHPSDQPLSEIVLVVQSNWYPGTFQ